jgi:hypothetical protein
LRGGSEIIERGERQHVGGAKQRVLGRRRGIRSWEGRRRLVSRPREGSVAAHGAGERGAGRVRGRDDCGRMLDGLAEGKREFARRMTGSGMLRSREREKVEDFHWPRERGGW